MKQNILISFLLIILSGCSSPMDCWDISKFKMVDTALQDNDEVELIYVYANPNGSNNNLEFYNHMIAVSIRTGDTVNILTSSNCGFEEKDIGKVFNYFGPNNIAAKVSQINPDDYQKTDFKKLETSSFKKINKVLKITTIDSKIYFRFPTVVGSLGKSC